MNFYVFRDFHEALDNLYTIDSYGQIRRIHTFIQGHCLVPRPHHDIARIVLNTPPPETYNWKYISKGKEIVQLIKEAVLEDEIAVDIKMNRNNPEEVSLILLATRKCNYLIDVLVLKPVLTLLESVFDNTKITKIVNGLDTVGDILKFKYNLLMRNVFDTFVAIKLLKNCGTFNVETSSRDETLKDFLQKHFRTKPDINNTIYEWNQRPLSEIHRLNAIKSVHYLIPMYFRLKLELVKKHLLQECLNFVYDLPTDVSTEELDEIEGVFPNMMYMKPSRVYIIYALNKWRKSLAASRRCSSSEILTDEEISKLSKTPPNQKRYLQKMLSSRELDSTDVDQVFRIFAEAKLVIGPVYSDERPSKRLGKKKFVSMTDFNSTTRGKENVSGYKT